MYGKKSSYIRQNGNDNFAFQDSIVNIRVSIFDEIARLKQEKDYEGIAELMKQVSDMAGTTHPLYPDYRYRPVQLANHFVFEHEPLTQDAKEKYPLSYQGRFNIKNKGDKDLNQLLDEAFIKQEEIEIDMISFQTWIGEIEVPNPNFDEVVEEGKWVIVPDSLPKPKLLKLLIRNGVDGEEKAIFDYLELNICDIDRKNNVYILDNSRDSNSKIYVFLKLNLNDSKVKIDVKIKSDYQQDVAANHSFLFFLKTLAEVQGILVFKNLQTDSDFIVANKFELIEKSERFEKDYRFMSRLLNLERYFNVKFLIPDQYDDEDLEDIQILESIMNDRPFKKTVKNIIVDCTERKALLELIQVFESRNQDGVRLKVTTTGEDARIELFKSTIPLEKVETTYHCLKMEDIEKMKRKYSDMEEGETVKVTLIPGEDNSLEEKYFVKKTSI